MRSSMGNGTRSRRLIEGEGIVLRVESPPFMPILLLFCTRSMGGQLFLVNCQAPGGDALIGANLGVTDLLLKEPKSWF